MGDILALVQENLTLILLGLMGVFGLLFFITGFLVGLRKVVYRWFTSLIFYAAAFILAAVMFNWIYNLPIGAQLISLLEQLKVTLPFELEGNTIKEIVTNVVAGYIGETGSAEAAEFALGVVTTIIKFLWFTVLGFVLFIVYWFITQIIYWIFFKGKRIKKDGTKRKKHRLTAAVLSFAKGCAIWLLFVIMLINTPMSLIPNNLLENNEPTNEEQLAQDISGILESDEFAPIFEIISTYKNSFFYKFFDGKEDGFSVNHLISAQIWSFKVGEETINLTDEVTNLLTLAKDVLALYEGVSNKDDLNIDYNSLANICYFFQDSKLINTLLPIGVGVAANIEDVKKILDEYHFDISCLDGINWSDSFKGLGDLAKEVGKITQEIEYIDYSTDGSTNPNKLLRMDLSSISEERLNRVFEILGSVSFFTKVLDGGVEALLQLDKVKNIIGDLEINLEDIIWGDEIANLGDVANAFIHAGFESVYSVTKDFKNAIMEINFGTEEGDLGAAGDLIDSLFASRFIDSIFAQVMENVVLPKIPSNYQSLFNFDKINDKGWPNELNDLLTLFKDCKNGEDPFFTDEGKINFKVLTGIKPETLLNSTILVDALVSVFADLANGEGALVNMKDTILVPDTLKDKESSAWKEEEPSYYVVSEAFGQYDKYERISLNEYATFEQTNKDKCKLQNKVVGGEIYNIIQAFSSLTELIDFSAIGGSGSPISLSESTLNKLVEKDAKGNTTVSKLSKSIILRSTLSKFLEGVDAIVMPNSCCEILTINNAEKKVVSSFELENVLNAVVKLGVIKDKHVANQQVTIESTTYNVGDEFTGDFNALTDEQKNCFDTTTSTDIDISIADTLNDLCDEDGHTKLEYVLGCDRSDAMLPKSEILTATISKILLDLDGTIIIPDEVKELNGEVTVIKDNELKELLTTIIELEIVDGNTINANLGLITKISGHYQYKPGIETTSETPVYDELAIIDHVNNSLIMRATISDKILDQSATITVLNDIIETSGTHKLIKEDELKAFVNAINSLGIIRTDNTIADLDSITGTILTDTSKQQAIASSVLLRATLSDKIASSLEIPSDGSNYLYDGEIIEYDEYKLLSSSERSKASNTFKDLNGADVTLISSSEIENLFASLNALGIENFTTVNVSFATIKSLKENDKLKDLLASSIIWAKTSDSVMNTTSGTGSTQLFQIPSFGDDVFEYYVDNADSSKKYTKTYVSANSISNVTKVTQYAFDRDLLDAATAKRLEVKEIESIIDLLILLGGNGDDFAPDASTLENIYKDSTLSAQFSNVMTSSIVLSKSVSSVFTTIIDSALSTSAFASCGDLIKERIVLIKEQDIGLWSAAYTNNTEYQVGTIKGCNTSELIHLLTGLSTVSSISDFSVLLTDKNYCYAIDDSFCLRPMLTTASVINYYEVTTGFTGVTGTYQAGNILTSAKYLIEYAANSSVASKCLIHEYSHEDNKATRRDVINNAY